LPFSLGWEGICQHGVAAVTFIESLGTELSVLKQESSAFISMSQIIPIVNWKRIAWSSSFDFQLHKS